MAKLKVIKEFGNRSVGDIFEYSEENDMWVCESINDDSYYDVNTDSTYRSVSTSKHEITSSVAVELITKGYLKYVSTEDDHKVEDENSQEFVNVFDEMSNLKSAYEKRLSNLEEEYKDQPACLKIESRTVLTNMVHLLDHLISLRKLKK